MKSLLIFLITLVIVSAQSNSNDDTWIAGQPLGTCHDVIESQVDQYGTCRSAADGAKFCTSTPGCNNSYTFQCFNGYPLTAKACPEYAKYCSGGSCVSAPPNACKPEFICPTAGYFPKYDDCSTYYYCYFDDNTNDLIYSTRICPFYYSFNPQGPLDRVCQRDAPCVTANCTAGKFAEWKALNYVSFTQDQIALYCSNGQSIRIDACSNGQSIDLNDISSRTCSIKCFRDYQKAVYDNDYKKYFNCLNGYSYVENCENGEVFDPKTLNCIASPNRFEVDNKPVDYCKNAQDFSTICGTSPGCNNTSSYMCYKGAALKKDPCVAPTPYCSGGSCVAIPPSGCTTIDFKCPGPGYFPKYDDCYTYYYCSGAGFTAQQIQCPLGYPFNPSGPPDRHCVKGSNCATVTCTVGKVAEWRAMNYVNFTQNQIAIYCANGIFDHVDTCDPGLSIDLTNTASKSCSIKCVKDYQTAVATNSTTGYLLCLGGKAYYQDCEVGQIFDRTTLSCVTKN